MFTQRIGDLTKEPTSTEKESGFSTSLRPIHPLVIMLSGKCDKYLEGCFGDEEAEDEDEGLEADDNGFFDLSSIDLDESRYSI